MWCVNTRYQIPLSLALFGVICVASGFAILGVFSAQGHLDDPYFIPVMIFFGVGGICLLIGCCACCTVHQRALKNWEECKRLQHIHQVVLGSPDDPGSQAQPIISGYDPRRSPWQPT